MGVLVKAAKGKESFAPHHQLSCYIESAVLCSFPLAALTGERSALNCGSRWRGAGWVIVGLGGGIGMICPLSPCEHMSKPPRGGTTAMHAICVIAYSVVFPTGRSAENCSGCRWRGALNLRIALPWVLNDLAMPLAPLQGLLPAAHIVLLNTYQIIV